VFRQISTDSFDENIRTGLSWSRFKNCSKYMAQNCSYHLSGESLIGFWWESLGM
jgi:hypothetical protein